MSFSPSVKGRSAREPRFVPLAPMPSRLGRLWSNVARGAAAIALPRKVLLVRGARDVADKRVALTFDDGPDEMTNHYLDLLAYLRVRVTFFLVGENASRSPELVREYVRRGHEIGGHGWSHQTFTSMSPGRLGDELARTHATFPGCGTDRRLVRPPRGELSPGSLLQIAAGGYTTVLWSVDSDDCRTRDPGVVERNLAPDRLVSGDIVLFHERQPWTLDALPAVIHRLRRDGWQLVTASELLP